MKLTIFIGLTCVYTSLQNVVMAPHWEFGQYR